MQEFVFFIEGDISHPLTIDPTVWIFDERKVDLLTYFEERLTMDDEETAYKKAISAQWDKEIIEGSAPPRPDTNGNEIKYEKQKLINGTFGMPLKPFLMNAKPNEHVTTLIVEQHNGTKLSFPFEDTLSFIIGFSKNGKPLREDGPVHLYFGDGSNQTAPIKNVKRLLVKR
ncbi:hypothetical protein [Halalkalibacter urbisdiaboli]|uniref:hypothetical protein n=1 Tax=Halalkalibacter urbisdiaboli TaxID=1960589 RepID=UPI000B42E673|nr:hypothetical protein [Halalkalibacter urbisdiaboli]